MASWEYITVNPKYGTVREVKRTGSSETRMARGEDPYRMIAELGEAGWDLVAVDEAGTWYFKHARGFL